MIILVFSTYYVPGYRGGGPIRSIQNMVERLGNEFDFRIICSDRDLGDSLPYPAVVHDQWVKVGNAHVFYASPKNQNIRGITNLIKNTPHDVIYLNSVFTLRFSLIPLLISKLLRVGARTLVLAPRGEFSVGALEIKSIKKRIFLAIVKKIGIYSDIVWQASSEHEAADIKRVIENRKSLAIDIASDLANVVTAPNLTPCNKSIIYSHSFNDSGTIKLLFLSRLSPKKNLDFALRALRSVSEKTYFGIIGPKEDLPYWSKCENIFSELPSNVTVQYLGVATPEEIPQIMANYDIFFFPTHGENFGHVIAEALSAGTPALISDRTPWRNLSSHGAGWDLPLDSPEEFTLIINNYAKLTPSDRLKLRESTKHFALSQLENPVNVESNRQLFIKALARSSA